MKRKEVKTTQMKNKIRVEKETMKTEKWEKIKQLD